MEDWAEMNPIKIVPFQVRAMMKKLFLQLIAEFKKLVCKWFGRAPRGCVMGHIYLYIHQSAREGSFYLVSSSPYCSSEMSRYLQIFLCMLVFIFFFLPTDFSITGLPHRVCKL